MKQHFCNFWVIQGISLGCLSISYPIQAQNVTIPDTTLPVNSQVELNNRTSSVTAGTVAGINLFHSFTQFSVDQGYRVDFVSPSGGIENILVRVTGNNPSNISGVLSTSGASNPNLFLINPQGISFGQNASLQINGSFVATTANALGFSEQGFFSASNPNNPALLTVNPSAFLFNQTVAQGIESSSTHISRSGLVGLQVDAGNSLLLIGGNITLNKGIITAPGGRVELGGLKDTGIVGLTIDGQELKLSFPDNAQRAKVTLTTGANVITTSGGGGDIVINAEELQLLDSSTLRTGIGRGLGSTGAQAGNIELNVTGLITIKDGSTIVNSVDSKGVGDGGDLLIKAGSLYINQAEVFTLTFGQGNAGDIFVQVDDSINLNRGGIHTNPAPGNAEFSQPANTGNGGLIDIKADTLSLTNSAQIYTTTYNRGSSGSINIDVRQLTMVDGSEIRSNTSGTGDAGDINLQASESIKILRLDAKSGFSSRVVAGSRVIADSEAENSGESGDINVTAPNLWISDGAFLSTLTRSSSQAGDIAINVNNLMLTNGGQIVASTYRGGSAGDISVSATDGVLITGSFDNNIPRSSQDNNGLKSGLFVDVISEQIAVAGNIKVDTPSLRIYDRGTISAETSAGAGGNIDINSQDIRLRDNALITASAGGVGNGGNITIDTDTLVALDNSDIKATAVENRGGNIDITTQGLFLSADSDIDASSKQGIDGVVEINRPESDPNDDTLSVPVEPVDLTELIATGCGASGGVAAKTSTSKFIITGRGGLPPTPTEVLKSDLALADLGTRQDLTARTITATKQVNLLEPKPPTPIVEAQGWIISPKGQVVLTASAPDVTPEVPWLKSPSCHNS